MTWRTHDCTHNEKMAEHCLIRMSGLQTCRQSLTYIAHNAAWTNNHVSPCGSRGSKSTLHTSGTVEICAASRNEMLSMQGKANGHLRKRLIHECRAPNPTQAAQCLRALWPPHSSDSRMEESKWGSSNKIPVVGHCQEMTRCALDLLIDADLLLSSEVESRQRVICAAAGEVR